MDIVKNTESQGKEREGGDRAGWVAEFGRSKQKAQKPICTSEPVPHQEYSLRIWLSNISLKSLLVFLTVK